MQTATASNPTLNSATKTANSPVIYDRPSIVRMTGGMEMIDKTIAQGLLARAYSGQRVVKERHTLYLKTCYRKGEFNPFDPITILHDLKDKSRFGLVNGNHRMTMIVEEDISIYLNVTRLYSNDFEADFEWLYATFDKSKQRTPGDTLAIFGTHNDFSITPQQASQIAKAATIIERDFSNHSCGVDYSAKSVIHLNDLLKNNGKNGALYLEDIKGASKAKLKALQTQDMFAVAIKLYKDNKADQTKIRAFYDSIAKGLFQTEGDAAKILAEAIVEPDWAKRSREAKRQIVESMFSRWLAKEECKKLSPYKGSKTSPDPKKSKKAKSGNVTIIGSNNTISI